MHSRGTPQTMTMLKSYPEPIAQMLATELRPLIQTSFTAGLARWQIWIDPGLGFAKGLPRNLEIMKCLPEFQERCGEYPMLVGPSRKKFVQTLCEVESPSKCLLGTAAITTFAIVQGASMLRIHDIELHHVRLVADALTKTQ